jgi:hypothetical protein
MNLCEALNVCREGHAIAHKGFEKLSIVVWQPAVHIKTEDITHPLLKRFIEKHNSGSSAVSGLWTSHKGRFDKLSLNSLSCDWQPEYADINAEWIIVKDLDE